MEGSRRIRGSGSKVGALALVALLAAGACGSGTEQTGSEDPTSSSSSIDTVAPSTSPTTPRTTAPPATAPRKNTYLPAGFFDQVFPPGTEAYKLLSTGQCGQLLREIRNGWDGGSVPAALSRLYRGAAEACLSQWDAASADLSGLVLDQVCVFEGEFATPSASSFSTSTKADCLKRRTSVFKWASALLDAHRADPSFKPNFSPPAR